MILNLSSGEKSGKYPRLYREVDFPPPVRTILREVSIFPREGGLLNPLSW